MNNSTMVKYGSDFLIYGNEVYLSHQFSLEYVKVILLMFLIGFVLGSGLISFVMVFSEELKDKLGNILTKM